MNDEKLQTMEQVKQFLEGSGRVKSKGVTVEEKYDWIKRTLVRLVIIG